MTDRLVYGIARAKYLMRVFSKAKLKGVVNLLTELDDNWPASDYRSWNALTEEDKKAWISVSEQWLVNLKNNRPEQYNILSNGWKDMDNKVVYILHPGHRPKPIDDSSEWFSVKPLKESLARLGYRTELICFDDYTLDQFNNLSVPAAVVFNHVISFYFSQKYAMLLDVIKSWDTVFLNDVDAQFITAKKSDMYKILSTAGISVPRTLVIEGDEELEESKFNETIHNAGISYPVVVKPDFGFKAKITQLCYDFSSVSIAVNNIKQTRFIYSNTEKKILRSPSIVQEYIGDYPDMFVRVCVLPGYTGGFIYLVSPYEDEKFVNYNKHKFRVAYKVDPDIEKTVKEAMVLLNVNAACCDVLISNNGDYKITDINCFGNLATNVFLSGINLFDYIAAFLDEKIKQR